MAYDPNNIFAKILRGEAKAVRVYENERTLAFLDIMPQSDGHTLVVPKSPAENLFDLDPEFAAAVMKTAQKVARAVKKAFNADGISLIQRNGSVAGQTIFHFHVNIVPTYADRSLKGHVQKMADASVLEEHAARIRKELGAGDLII